MKYDITKSTAPVMPNLGKGSNKDKPNLVRHQRPLRMHYLCTVKKQRRTKGPTTA
ncbi:MAG: hypothetical protein IJQ05_08570 [Bacteroidaceae bacterium]|nr:hypothetical protein [Bacteroidaceae bacterium]